MICRSNQTKNNINARRSRFLFPCAFFIILINAFTIAAQPSADTNDCFDNSFERNINAILENKAVRCSFTAVPLFLESWIYSNKDINFRQIRNDVIPNFRYDYDTYLQFTPLGLIFALKASGVPSHSSWGQLGLNVLLSYGVGYGLVKIMKANISELRPDWGGLRSFPSGHTTVAFISASLLSKEYKDQYPWLSVAGYAAASVTGISRVMNNRHWLHDVLFGSGLGIMATELSYVLTDIIFSTPDNNRFTPSYSEFINDKPNYLNFYLASAHCLNKYPKKSGRNMPYAVHSGSAFGIEAAYFFTKNFGLSTRIKGDGYWFDNKNIDWPADSVFSFQSFDIAPEFSYPLIHRLYAGLRIGIGLSHVNQKMIQYYMVLPKQTHWLYTCGIFANVWTNKHSYLRFYIDYNHTKLKVDNKTQPFSTLATGATIGLHF